MPYGNVKSTRDGVIPEQKEVDYKPAPTQQRGATSRLPKGEPSTHGAQSSPCPHIWLPLLATR